MKQLRTQRDNQNWINYYDAIMKKLVNINAKMSVSGISSLYFNESLFLRLWQVWSAMQANFQLLTENSALGEKKNVTQS